MANDPEFVLVVVCKILAIEVYCYQSGWDVTLFGTVAYGSASSSAIDINYSGSVRLSFPLKLSWWLLM